MHRETVDVVIIGGGASGLAAASMLHRSGFEVVVLEGRDRIGGRVHTLRKKSIAAPVELGAEFVHGKPPEIWDIVRERMLKAPELTGNNFCYAGRLRECNDFWSDWERVSKEMKLESGQDESFLTFIDRLVARQPELEKARRRSLEYVEGFNAAPPGDISLASLIQDREASEEIDGSRPFQMADGYDQIIEALAEDLVIRKRRIVKHIRWKSGSVTAEALDQGSGSIEEFEANAAVVTLPLGVLQSSDELASVQFTPDIRVKLDAANALKMGGVVKVILAFRQRFWSDRGFGDFAFLHAQDQSVPVFWTTAGRKTAILTGWAGGSLAEALENLPQREILNSVLTSLAKAFSTSISHLRCILTDSFVVPWRRDPFSKGAYSYTPVGQLEARKVLAAPLEDTLFFAGEATNTEGFSGTVHGAVSTGRRTAEEIRSVLKPKRRIA